MNEERKIREINNLKGRLAEELVKSMFIDSGYCVVKSGVEHIFPEYVIGPQNENDELGMWLRRFPDFIVRKDDHSRFVEVKFVTKFHAGFYKRFEIYTDYPEAYIIVVTPEIIDCRSIADIKTGIRFDNLYQRYLEVIKEAKELKDSDDLVEDIELLETDNLYRQFAEDANRLNNFGIHHDDRKFYHSCFLGIGNEFAKTIEVKNIKSSQKQEKKIGSTLYEIKSEIADFPVTVLEEDLEPGQKLLRQQHKRAYEKWTKREEDLLKKAFGETKELYLLTKVFLRHDGSLASRIQTLELI